MSCTNIEDITMDKVSSEMREERIKIEFVRKLISNIPEKADKKYFNKKYFQNQRIFKTSMSKSQIRIIFYKFFSEQKVPYSFKRWIIKKNCRSRSGVLVNTVTLAPQWTGTSGRKSGSFSCSKNCSYCPQETNLEGIPTQPRSYLSNEPAMLRALRYDFDIRGQFWDRISSYIKTGNINLKEKGCCKMEVIVSGGTWECFPEDYRDTAITELYWAANTYGEEREMLSLEEEIHINETAKYRIIGLTLETRPDFINKYSIMKYCRYGVTRIQIGVQHYDDVILKKINRGCYTRDTIRAIRLLKQAGFKVVVHLMPDLPGSSPESDKWMFQQAITRPELQFDDIKIYPTAVCRSTDPTRIVKSKILEWYDEGLYKPYAEQNIEDLIDVISHYLKNVNPWVRIQRIVRDIPTTAIKAGYQKKSNLRQILNDRLKKEKIKTHEIRSMEIGDRTNLYDNTRLVVRKYQASEGIEYFLSIEAYKNYSLDYICYLILSNILWFFTGKYYYWSGNKDREAIIGFLRLRFDPSPGGNYIPELFNSVLIREVHVYGKTLGIGSDKSSSQHRGYGKMLVRNAEIIANQRGYNRAAVIAGVGTREYYKNKCGYHLEGTYMVKNINYRRTTNNLRKAWLYLFLFFVFELLICFIF